jgi:hypothetical protein
LELLFFKNQNITFLVHLAVKTGVNIDGSDGNFDS